ASSYRRKRFRRRPESNARRRVSASLSSEPPRRKAALDGTNSFLFRTGTTAGPRRSSTSSFIDRQRTRSLACPKKLRHFFADSSNQGTRPMLPPKDRLTICFAHAAYQLQSRFRLRSMAIDTFEVRTAAEIEQRIGDADVVVVSGLWRNALLERAPRL